MKGKTKVWLLILSFLFLLSCGASFFYLIRISRLHEEKTDLLFTVDQANQAQKKLANVKQKIEELNQQKSDYNVASTLLKKLKEENNNLTNQVKLLKDQIAKDKKEIKDLEAKIAKLLS